MYTEMLDNVLRGGGRRRNARPTRRAASSAKGPRTRHKLQGAGRAADLVDRDVMVQQFNHSGTVEHVALSADEMTASVIAPLVKQVLHAHFPHAAGHKLVDVVKQRGYKVPGALDDAKRTLQQFAQSAASIRQNWDQGVYTTVETMVSTAHSPAMVMELFACVAMVMDSYSQLSLEDAQLVLPALFTCICVLQPAIQEKTLAAWKAQPYSATHLAQIDELRQQVQHVEASQGTAMAGGGSSSSASSAAVDVSRRLLALNVAMHSKRQLLRQYEELVGGAAPTTAAGAAGSAGSAPPASLASSILGGTAADAPMHRQVHDDGKRSHVDDAPAAMAAAAPAPARRKAAARAAAPAKAVPAATPTFSEHKKLQQKVQQLKMSGGTPKSGMKQPTIVSRDLGGEGIHLYAYLTGGKLHVDFMLEELTKGGADTAQMKKRLAYLSTHRDKLSDAVSGSMDVAARRALAIEIGQHTDDTMANAINALCE